ncbi:MAG: alkaline phosphatase family protein [Saprospiraceae bacterium]|nr:alkaline phosphatase family protein [Saprospiraceae bacterium]
MKSILTTALLFLFIGAFSSCVQSQTDRYVFVVTLDGMRWQDVFHGADSSLLFNTEYTSDTAYFIKKYWTPDPLERRRRLMPFLWSVIEREGQIYGNRDVQNNVNVSNGKWFSYPGYNELFTGAPDDARINSNAKIPNPTVNVFEWLNRQPAYQGKVAAFGSWDVFPYILNEERAGFMVNAGFEDRTEGRMSEQQRLLNRLQHQQPKPWLEAERYDVFTGAFADEYIRTNQPSVCYIGFGDTDEFAHSGDYDMYLDAARQNDQWIADLWRYLQSDKKYAGKTSLLIATDHGRGDAVKSQWRDHNASVKGADQIWMAAIGPEIAARGEVRTPMQLWQKQVASTIARMLGQTFKPAHEVAPPVAEMFRN